MKNQIAHFIAIGLALFATQTSLAQNSGGPGDPKSKKATLAARAQRVPLASKIFTGYATAGVATSIYYKVKEIQTRKNLAELGEKVRLLAHHRDIAQSEETSLFGANLERLAVESQAERTALIETIHQLNYWKDFINPKDLTTTHPSSFEKLSVTEALALSPANRPIPKGVVASVLEASEGVSSFAKSEITASKVGIGVGIVVAAPYAYLAAHYWNDDTSEDSRIAVSRGGQ